MAMMPLTPSRVLHSIAGSPPVKGCESTEGRCTICAHPAGRGMKYSAWQGNNFTDQNKLRLPGSGVVCEPCVWAHSWVAPPGHEPPAPGRRGPNLRMFSHIWEEPDDYTYVRGKDRHEIADFLRRPKYGRWFAAIAETGKKHVLPRTPINSPEGKSGLVRFEDQTVSVGPLELLDDMEQLLVMGKLRRGDLGRGQPSRKISGAALVELYHFRQRWNHILGSGWFNLCLWMAREGR